MRGKVFDAEFYRGEISRLNQWLTDLGITQDQRDQWNRERESAKLHLAELTQEELDRTADHTSKAVLEARLEKLR